MHATAHLHTPVRAPLYAFPGLRQVLRGLQSESDFLKNNMVRLCCPKGIAEQYQGSAKVFEPANGTLYFEEAKESLNLYTTTLHAINSAIIKLGKLTEAKTVYRGIGGKALPKEFWEKNRFGVRGGVEPAFMSTTLNREVAMTYASGSDVGIVLAIRQGMVNRGADISWLSQYPHEKECAAALAQSSQTLHTLSHKAAHLPDALRPPCCGRILFGPLTGIEVLSTRIDGSVVVIECDFSINLTALTLEQVLGKRRNLIDQMSEQIVDQLKQLLKGTGYAEHGVSLMEAEVAAARKDDPEWYNEDANFLAAVQAVLDAKALVLGPAKLEWIAGLAVEEAELHAPLVLASAKSGDEHKVRAAFAVLNSFEGYSTWKVVDQIALEALHRSTGGGGEVGRTERVASVTTYWGHYSHKSSRGLFLDDKGWCSGKPLREWMGVTVDETTGRVTELQLKGCGLKGHLPLELAFLTDLETLDLRDNPELAVPTHAEDLGLLDMTGQMHLTDKGRVQAFIKHAALPEGKKEEALLVKKHGPDGPALKRVYNEGNPKFTGGYWFDKVTDVSKWHGVSADAEGRVAGLSFEGSGISTLSKSVGELCALQTLDLAGCTGLVSLPEQLGECKGLQTLDLRGCTGLVSLPEQLGECKGLQTLDLRGCTGLVSLPERLGECKALQTLDLEHCSRLVSLPDVSRLTSLKVQNLFRHLEPWKASGYTAFDFADWLDTQINEGTLTELRCPVSLTSLPERLGECKALQTLDLEHCSGLVSLPERLGECTGLQTLHLSECKGLVSLPERLGELKTLQKLNLNGCSGLVSLPERLGECKALQTLDVLGCSGLVSLPERLGECTGLQTLDLSSCSGLVSLPERLGECTALQTLKLDCCSGLVSLPERLGECNALQTLDLTDCSGLVSLPERLGECTGLQTLDLNGCSGLVSLPERLGECTGLQTLNLEGCSGLVSLPERLGECKALQTLRLEGCSGLVSLPERLGECTGLQTLDLRFCSSLVSLPERLGECTALQTLNLSECTGLVSLPERLGECKALQTLDLRGCTGLVSLPERLGECKALQTLNLNDCSGPRLAAGAAGRVQGAADALPELLLGPHLAAGPLGAAAGGFPLLGPARPSAAVEGQRVQGLFRLSQ